MERIAEPQAVQGSGAPPRGHAIDNFRACERSAAMLAAIGLLVSRSLLAESHLFGETRACGSILRRHHGIIAAKTPFLPILLWCEVVMGAQVSLERLEFLSVLKADDVVRSNRFLY